jgi:hypothetical protein
MSSKFITFAEKHLGQKLWAKQKEILQAIEQPHARVTVRANNGCGKSFIAMVGAMAFAATYSESIVLVMSPSWRQTLQILMEKIKGFARDPQHESLPYTKLNEDEVLIFDSKIYALSSNVMERLSGYHAEHLLIILDEASGIDPRFVPALEGISAAGDVRWLVISNPTRSAGFFYETHSPRNKLWTKFAISALDSPNCEGHTLEQILEMTDRELNANPWPQLTSRRWVRDMYYEWFVGKQALWQQRVLGNFADLRSEALFAMADLEACSRPASVDPSSRDLKVGIDPSLGGGDATGVTICSGNAILACERILASDNFEATLRFLEPYKDRIQLLCVDTIGLGATWPRLFQRAGYRRVEGVNVAEAPRSEGPTKYNNLKAERYVALSNRVRARLIAGMTPELVQELGAIEQTSRDGDGAVMISGKKEVKSILGHSPDLAESLMVVLGGPDLKAAAQDARENMALMSRLTRQVDNTGEPLTDPYADIDDLGLNSTGAGPANRAVSRGSGRIGAARLYGRFRNW